METGFICHVNNLGGVMLPDVIMSVLDLKEGDPLQIWIDVHNENIVLQKHVSPNKCTFCKTDKNVVYHVNKPVCKNCIKTMGLKYD